MSLAAGFVLAGCFLATAQTGGLEGIIVEKYYVSSSADTITADTSGYLAPGSVTYRIYADLKPVYRLQAVYGVENHELKIQTSTRFYNCKFSDGRSANDIQPSGLTYGTALLDSWVSMGAAAMDYQGVLKSEDDTTANLALLNSSKSCNQTTGQDGEPLIVKDGMKYLRYQPATQFYNFDNDLHVFEYAWRDSVSGILRTMNGAWASFGGTVGPQPENRVLIAQLTTDGVLEFELNIQIATPDGKVEKYVARNPANDENLLPSLVYSSSPQHKSTPVSFKCLLDMNKVEDGQVMKFLAESESKSVETMEFYVDNRPMAVMKKAPFEFQFKADGKAHSFYVKALNKNGTRGCSSTLLLPASTLAN